MAYTGPNRRVLSVRRKVTPTKNMPDPILAWDGSPAQPLRSLGRRKGDTMGKTVLMRRRGRPTVPTNIAALAILTQPSAAPQAGVAFAQQPVVELRDILGNPVLQADITVAVTVSAGNGTLASSVALSAATDNQGRATFQALRFDGQVGVARRIAFVAAGLPAVESTDINLVPGPALTVTEVTPLIQSTNVGEDAPEPPAVMVTDQFGNPVEGFDIDWTLTATGGAGGAIAPASPVTIPTEEDGISAVDSWTHGATPGVENAVLEAVAT